MWRRRLEVEREKQRQNPNVNLTNRILSICVAALERWPRSRELWDIYIAVTQVYPLLNAHNLVVILELMM